MTNEKAATPSHIVVTELDTLITKLTDAAFDCGDYDDSKSDDGYKVLFDAEQKAIEELKTYVATVRKEEREAAFKEAIEIASRHKEHSGYTLHQHGAEALDCRNVIWRELEAALTEK